MKELVPLGGWSLPHCAVTAPKSVRSLLINRTKRHSNNSLVPRPHPSAREKGLVKNDNIPGPEAGIWESQSDRSICN